MVSNRKRNQRIRTWDRWLNRCWRLAGQFAPRTTHDLKPVFKPTPGYWRSEGVDFFAVFGQWKARGVDVDRNCPGRDR